MLAPATIEEGILGREGIHVWNGFALNFLQDGLPYFRIREITGLRDKPDADNNSANNTARDGETLYPSALRGRTVVYTGRLIARNLPELRTLSNAFVGAMTGNALGAMIVGPPAARGGVSWVYSGRVLTATCTEVRDLPEGTRPSPWQAEFVLTIRQPIAVNLETTDLTETGTTSVVVENLGTAPAYPKVTVEHDEGPVNIVSSTGRALRFKTMDAGTLVVDFLRRTALNDTTDVIARLDDADSDWWDELVPGIVPGTQTISQEGGDNITVDYNHTSY